ncbi:hypothetical protein N7462_010283 [Penicillium macrosclerotiorum]|uniref:uncharacterized protein n=1 Tax=Penicillium macrosclerotiorum TaxID=303699 RepID=UPI002547B096|nr:uncharacterized protein N7462_010283 [Penicillium macrosclerotiorum]KAJ5669213.1 hypothetical protein N7462_010283 [Penicillium macrosclerotiorum]
MAVLSKGLPPGPPTIPILGNLHQLPKTGAFLKFTEWARKYGGVYSFKIGNSTTIVLTDRKLVREVVDKRGAKYSYRPPSYVSHDLITKGDHILVMQYGTLWRLFRKIAHQYFTESIVEKEYVPIQEAEAVQMIRDLCLQPDQHMMHPRRFSNSVIMSLIFGIRTAKIDTPHMLRLYHLLENWVQVMEPGATPPVDIFPIFRWLPERLYGNWETTAKGVGSDMDSLYGSLLQKAKNRRKSLGSHKPSLMDSVLDQNEKLGLNEHQMAFLGGVLVEGGSDTTASVILSFIHALTKWPEVLKKAQAEVDTVIGEDRSPVWKDYNRLPYIATIVKEAMRWRPAVPLAFPHAVNEDDWIDGYFIPKGSTVVINVWGLHHDPEHFANPDVFDPDHFKGQTALAPELAASIDSSKRDHYGYGSGRRICGGMHVAERNLWLAIAKIVWAFDISAGVDEKTGLPIIPDVNPQTGYKEGLVLTARPFSCDISVRSEARRATILQEFEKAERDIFSQFES